MISTSSRPKRSAAPAAILPISASVKPGYACSSSAVAWPCSPRAMPTKVATAPVSLRPAQKAESSAPGSNGSTCSRTVTGGLAAAHRRQERDFGRGRKAGLAADDGLVDRGLHAGAADGGAARRILGGDPRPQRRQARGRIVEHALAPAGEIAEAPEEQDAHRFTRRWSTCG